MCACICPSVCVCLQGEESVKERITLDEDKVVPFLEMEYGLEEVRATLGRVQGLGWDAHKTFAMPTN